MPKIGPRYARDMPKICPRYARDMPKICSRYAQDMTTRKMVLTKRLPDKTSKPVHLKKMSHKSVLTKRLPDKTSKLVLTKRLPDKTSKAVLTKCLPDKTSADPQDEFVSAKCELPPKYMKLQSTSSRRNQIINRQSKSIQTERQHN